jgi:protein gp37
LHAWEEGLKLAGGDEQKLLERGFVKPRRPRVFCGSLCDWLDDEVLVEWLADLLALIHDTPHLNWTLLTKRPENFRLSLDLILDPKGKATPTVGAYHLANDWRHGEPPDNVWVGVTVENQEMADERIPELLKIPAKVRFLSCEPLLGSVVCPDVRDRDGYWSSLTGAGCRTRGAGGQSIPNYYGPKVDWVIAGGESGPKARPMHRTGRGRCVTSALLPRCRFFASKMASGRIRPTTGRRWSLRWKSSVTAR